ncbi:AAA family ATPase [Kineosporia rhizophila]|uniref:AAA family ATPase n=1 Tax=Kineosporia TaxID=49184 RepID=UPI001E577987|nr:MULTISPECIES: AAA family ATPase [Kineosporia]MCE0536206.1 AAA family ATPase [Kineosporia rhizophila]GLY15206.1 helix-turn-helix transcriptional regulator [Kineosporia sp. NBRC 101677]
MTAQLLERTAELAAAQEVRRAARTGSGGLVIVAGGPGAGRSALLEAICEQTAGDLVLRASGSVLEQDYDFGVVRQLLPHLLSAIPPRLRPGLGNALELVAQLVPEDEEPPAWPALLPALTALVAGVSQEQPLTLVVDDLHWADTSSLRWLGHLAARLGHLPVSVFAGIAEGVSVPEGALLEQVRALAGATLQPAPLSLAAVGELVRDTFGVDADAGLSHILHRVTAANPAALDIVLRGLREEGLPVSGPGLQEVEERGHLLLRDRRTYCLSLQPPLVQAMARAMAVLGSVPSDDAVGRDAFGRVGVLTAADPWDHATAVRSLDRLGLFSAGGTTVFVHPSVPDALLSVVSVDEREELHRRAASLLHAAGFRPGDVAQQLLTITSGHAAWEAGVLRQAAREALERGAGRLAAGYLRPLLFEAPPGSAERGRLLMDVAVAERGADLAASVRHVTQALLVLPTAQERGAAALCVPPGPAAATPAVAEALREAGEAPAEDPDFAARIEAHRRALEPDTPQALAASVERLQTMDVDQHLCGEGGRELLAVLLRAGTVGAGLRAGTVAGLGAKILLREPARWSAAFTVLPSLIQVMVTADAVDRAEHWALTFLHEAGKGDSAPALAVATAGQAVVRMAQGRLREARAAAHTAMDLPGFDAPDWPEVCGSVATVLSSVALATHEPQACERVLQLAQATDDPRAAVAARTVRGVQALSRGAVAEATDAFRSAGAQAARLGWHNPQWMPWRPAVVEALAASGRPAQAADLAEEEHAAALDWGTPTAIGRALGLKAALAGPDEALDLWREAVGVLGSSPDLMARARATTALARQLEGARMAGAEDTFVEAARLSAECGLTDAPPVPGRSQPVGPPTAAVTGAVAAQSARPAALRSVGVRGVELTPSEESVLGRVRQGWTNQQIADSLGISRRAVEKTLTGTYRKFGVRGRTELLAVLGN